MLARQLPYSLVMFGWPEVGLVLKQVVAFCGAILAMSLVIDIVTIDGPGLLRSARATPSAATRRLARRYGGSALRRIALVGVLLLITKLVYRVPRLDVTGDVLWYTAFMVIGVAGVLLVWSSYHRKKPHAKPLP